MKVSCLQDNLAKGLADKIVKLFYTHTITDKEAARLSAERQGLP